jgi:DNA-binding NarL/FixJ family response regulator
MVKLAGVWLGGYSAKVSIKPAAWKVNHIMVTDISMPLLNGLEAVRKLKAEGISVKVIVLTMHREARIAEDAFRAGASGYLLKESAGDELTDAIQQVFDGHNYLTPLIDTDLLSILIDARRREPADSGLTPRQREVLQLVVEGKTMKEAAALLNISARTVESHKYEMMQALGIETTAELIQYGLRSGLFESSSRQAAVKAGR